MFLKIRKRYLLRGFDWEENSEKGLKQWKKSIDEVKAESVYLCVRKKKVWKYEIR